MRHSRALTIVLATAVAFACSRRAADEDGSGPNAGSFDKRALLEAFGTCALGTYTKFRAAADDLQAKVAQAAVTPTSESKDAARAAWRAAIDVWQEAEVMQFGPAAMTGPGAADMRDGIYAWPLVNRCLIDSQTVDKSYESSLAAALASTRGLGAMEYLLFYEGPDNGCAPEVTINKDGTWAALGADEIGKRRLAYASAVAADVARRAHDLEAAWKPDAGNFLATLRDAPNATFTSEQMAFNAVSDAAYYVDDYVKTMKVGHPAGLTADCTTPPCLDRVESPWAKHSKENLAHDLDGLEDLLVGCGPSHDGLGFDDLLVAVGAAPTRDRLVSAVANARAALTALTEPTFEDDLVKNPAGVKAFFESLRNVFVVMKSEVATDLDLNPPQRVASDND